MSIDPISAKKALEALMRTEQSPREDPERDALDREDLQKAEYAEMGLRAPSARPASAGLRNRLTRFLGRRA
jgi:hypothetical protein